MKIIDIEQGTPEWLAWRKTIITATEASAIMGSNPWVTPYKAWQRKLGLIPEQVSNEKMEKGKRLEPLARAQYIKETGIDVKPCCVQSTEYNFLGASLDGITPAGNVLEIKCGGLDLHNMAMHGFIPEYYQDQIQHQLLVTGALQGFYYSYFEGNGIGLEISPDPKWVVKYLEKAREWWRCIAMYEAPPMVNKDYRDMNSNFNWSTIADEYKKIDEKIKDLEGEKIALRQALVNMCEDQSCLGEGIKVMKMVSKGRVDYDRVPELKGIDLDKYRKEPAASWKITIDKE